MRESKKRQARKRQANARKKPAGKPAGEPVNCPGTALCPLSLDGLDSCLEDGFCPLTVGKPDRIPCPVCGTLNPPQWIAFDPIAAEEEWAPCFTEEDRLRLAQRKVTLRRRLEEGFTWERATCPVCWFRIAMVSAPPPSRSFLIVAPAGPVLSRAREDWKQREGSR